MAMQSAHLETYYQESTFEMEVPFFGMHEVKKGVDGHVLWSFGILSCFQIYANDLQ
jgi:hypothetical protein